MVLRSKKAKRPEDRLDALAAQQKSTLSVFEYAVQDLEEIAAEAAQVRAEAEEESRRHQMVATVADQQHQDAVAKATRLKDFFA